jgi:PAS domain S-box-containing protein
MSPSDSSLQSTEKKFISLLNEGPISYSMFRGSDFVIELANDEALKLWGKDKSVIGKKLTDAIPELIGQPYLKIIENVYHTGMTYEGKENLAYLEKNGVLTPVYVNFIYKAVPNDAGDEHRILCVGYDVTEQVTSRKATEDAEARARFTEKKFRNTVSQAPVGMAILKGPDFNFEMANHAYLGLIEKNEEEVIGKNLFDCLPEVKPVVEPLLKSVMESGIAYHAPELKVVLKRSGKKENAFFNLVYEPMKEADGSVSGIMVVANEVTEQVNSKYILSQSEEQFRKVVMESPIAMTILKGPDFMIDVANETMLKNIWRREEKDIIGRSILKAFPELESQQFPDLLRNVMKTKKTYRENEALAYVEGNDGMKKFYLDFEYAPVFDTDHEVSGIIITVYDVTSKVELRQQIAEFADRLQLATEGTKLATWDLDLNTRHIFHSAQLAEFFGHDKQTTLTHLQMREQIHPEDRKNIVEEAFRKALDSGFYNYEARVVRPDKSICWIKTAGKVYYNEAHKPVRMLGTMMDITEQRIQDENNSRLAAIVQSTSDAIIAVNLDRLITNWNASAERTFGYTEAEIIGKPITTLIPKDLWYQEDEIFDKILKDEPIEHLETIRKHKSGSLIDISLSISPIKDKQGNIVSISKIARDVSRQKNIERLIGENEERLKILVETSELGTWELDLIDDRLGYSARFLQFMGYHESETPSYSEVRERLHPDDLKVRALAFEQAYEHGVLNYKSRLIWRDGSMHWMEAKGRVLYDDHHKPLKIIGTLRDLTEERRKQQKIEENELRLRTAALSSELGTWDYDPKTEVMRWDDASRKLFGVGPDVPVTVDLFWECMHPDDRPAALARMLEALNPDMATNYESEYRIVGLPHEEVRWIHAKGKAFFDEDRIPYHFSGTVLDVTEKRMALEELKDSERKFRLLADSMPQFIWTGDVHGTLNYFNRSVYKYSGLTPEYMAEHGWIQIVHPDEREENIRLWTESVTNGTDFLFEHRFRRSDGEYRWQLSRAIPQKDANGNIQMWVGTSTDIHDQKTFAKDLELKVQERTKDLQQANQELERMNEELASFAYVSSHDLQEPLRKIQTFANRISEKEVLSDAGKDYFRRMQDAAQRMHLLIEDLLAYSRTSTTEKVFETTDLNTLMNEVTHDLEQVIKEKQASIDYHNLPVMNIIPFQFRQLFTNILSNALKFSKQDVPSHISIRAEQVQGGESGHSELVKDRMYHHLTVQDNGIGFSPEYNARIFEVFQRLHGKHEYKGTGIGLAICKKIVENHHGSISAVGEQGVGATFHIYVPV